MQLIPAIDLRRGGVVRLEQGDYDREINYDNDPITLASKYQNAGASLIHIVDLDSARDGGDANLEIIQRICSELSIDVQTGGGVRALADVEARLEAGARRVVIGSLCVRDPDLVAEWLGDLGPDAIVAGLDVAPNTAGGWVPKAAGWTESGHLELFALLEKLQNAGLRHLLCTDIERDGMFSGPSVELYQSIVNRFPAVQLQASGGISDDADLHAAERTGVAACIVGRALLESRVSLNAIRQWSR
ncbi:1-(5-phosphoribosyl)-5-[(5-phosphoribosylamino)methylideneamino]imidazole-4-carboxamide isomerase [Wenzhouxiangella limi]|uniref:1-(5-phosphoribosyl)-5-[(5-phosphoribosylamino)methylideneamino] imidazole-4-carboxamide isomerase n=1 Tax=Wenzhouxiangella limi TaxID=2707351 RepID=A0A845UUT5_9GAMM|nr:1-(5-phosphoribosyl)-5-[(5-phosphoribosylamino)methylideneamino]imidazole-4-carboxamide isomerase [Wenzhouxiangella limi]NDY94318.1 1-(5-phosphoribosyl)-5-[(5-phosphoribosylamino)methylideneamino]imidazole-4-carboxamide isomerase [Wenzhouxiangella limi]